MTDLHERELEQRLAALSSWEGETPGLWRAALAAHRERAQSRWRLMLARPAVRVGLAAAAVFTIVAVGWLATQLSPWARRHELSAVVREPAFSSTPPASAAPARPSLAMGRNGAGAGGGIAGRPPMGDRLPLASRNLRQLGSAVATFGDYDTDIVDYNSQNSSFHVTDPARASDGAATDATRHVIRQATIALEVADVRATFARAQLLWQAALDEYVESSSLTGDEEHKTMRAELVLRVRAERLSEVLNQLRQLGAVVDETSGGQDVTGQVVDLEARLRNERRIEQELLELMESRRDDDLSDILNLRRQLGSVREDIERLQGQRTHLARMVALARVLVIIRPEPDEEKPDEKPEAATIFDHFTGAVGDAWTGGLRVLADTVAGLLRVAVGGLVWWVIAAVLLVVALRHRRRVREGLA